MTEYTESAGWMPGIDHMPTEAWGYPDVAVEDMYPQAVMSHVMQGYQATMLMWARERPYHTPKSAHFTIGRGGRIVQHVSIWNPAWAAGDVRSPSWDGVRLWGPNPNKYLVHIEHEGFSIRPGYGYDYVYSNENPWPEELIEASIGVHRWVFERCQWLLDDPDKERRVVTHSMTDSVNRAQDPGDLWLATVRPRLVAAVSRQPESAPAPEPTPAPVPESPKAVALAQLVRDSADSLRNMSQHLLANAGEIERLSR